MFVLLVVIIASVVTSVALLTQFTDNSAHSTVAADVSVLRESVVALGKFTRNRQLQK
jgi:hypothetical protein